MGQFLPGIPGLLRKGGRGRGEGVEEPIHWSLNSLFLLPSFPGCQNSCCCWKTLLLVQQPFCRSNTCVGGIFHPQPHPHTHTPRRCFLISQSTRPNSFLAFCRRRRFVHRLQSTKLCRRRLLSVWREAPPRSRRSRYGKWPKFAQRFFFSSPPSHTRRPQEQERRESPKLRRGKKSNLCISFLSLVSAAPHTKVLQRKFFCPCYPKSPPTSARKPSCTTELNFPGENSLIKGEDRRGGGMGDVLTGRGKRGRGRRTLPDK